ncbi:MAG TPA: HNH endonuclease [Ilumatobacteraceae bacterium]|nr:HNH endonuclease [Ilumatobacteraceae bacterium]
MDLGALCDTIGRGDRTVDDVADELFDATDTELDERVRGLELLRRRVESEMALTLATVEQRRLYLADGHRTMKGYLRATCNSSNSDIAAGRRLASAANGVPGLAEALQTGRIGVAQAAAIARVYRNPRVRDRLIDFAAMLLELAERYCYDDFVIALQRFEMLADTDGAHRDRDAQIAGRNVNVTTVGGELHLDANGGDPLVNDELQAIFRRFCENEFRTDAAARRAEHGDDASGKPLARTHGQRSYDAFVDMLRRANAHLDTDANAPAAPNPLVNLLCDQRTWAMVLADAGLAPTTTLSGDPIDPFTGMPAHATGDLLADLLADPDAFARMRCETAGGTPLHPHDVLRAALAGHIRRVVVDAQGVVIDMGRKARLFTGPAREAAKLLVRRCDHAGCDLPEDFCEVDHVTEWVDLGTTDQINAGVDCGHHNREKHRKKLTRRRCVHGQSYTIRPDGSIILPVGARPPTFPDDSDDDAADEAADDTHDDAIEIAHQTRRARARLRALRRAS